MQFKDKLSECAYCNKPLVWVSRITRWYEDRKIQDFTFRCDVCKREFLYRDNRLFEKKPVRNEVGAVTAIRKLEHKDALNRRCTECGGPLTNDVSGFQCVWCNEKYILTEGVLVTKPPEPKPRMTLSEAASGVHTHR